MKLLFIILNLLFITSIICGPKNRIIGSGSSSAPAQQNQEDIPEEYKELNAELQEKYGGDWMNDQYILPHILDGMKFKLLYILKNIYLLRFYEDFTVKMWRTFVNL
jgi:hypothetical protein